MSATDKRVGIGCTHTEHATLFSVTLAYLDFNTCLCPIVQNPLVSNTDIWKVIRLSGRVPRYQYIIQPRTKVTVASVVDRNQEYLRF